MKKIILIVIGLALIGTAGWFIVKSRTGGQGQAVLKVTSNPGAIIFLDNQNIGKIPYEEKHAAGEYTLKLTPESTDTALSWEGKIKLSRNLLTFVNRDLGDSELTSAGEILTLEKSSTDKAELAVLSNPDGATVTLSGEDKGTTPLILSDIEPGSYDLSVTSAGFKSRSVKIKTTAGFKLTAEFKLAGSEDSVTATPEPASSPDTSPKTSPKATPKATPKASNVATVSGTSKTKASPPPNPYVEILDTPTGFLRVRKEPSTSSEEVARVNPEEFYPLLDEENGWYKIEYQTGKEGWISGQYAEKFE